MANEENIIANDLSEQTDNLSEKNIGNQFTQMLVLKKRRVRTKHRHVIIKQRSISSDTLIWGSFLFGIWRTDKWGYQATQSFIRGHIGAVI